MLMVDRILMKNQRVSREAEASLAKLFGKIEDVCDVAPYVSGNRVGGLTATWNPGNKLVRVTIDAKGSVQKQIGDSHFGEFKAIFNDDFRSILEDYSKSFSGVNKVTPDPAKNDHLLHEQAFESVKYFDVEEQLNSTVRRNFLLVLDAAMEFTSNKGEAKATNFGGVRLTWQATDSEILNVLVQEDGRTQIYRRDGKEGMTVDNPLSIEELNTLYEGLIELLC